MCAPPLREPARGVNVPEGEKMASFHGSIARYLTALWLITGVPGKAQQSSSGVLSKSYSRVDGVPFAQGESGPLLADMYLPQQQGRLPAILFIHGGGWTMGKRDSWDKLIVPFAARGYVGMTIDYDLSPGVHFPVALEECKAAVRWLRAHATEYHVDPNRIAVAGGSAGGELAALVALTGTILAMRVWAASERSVQVSRQPSSTARTST